MLRPATGMEPVVKGAPPAAFLSDAFGVTVDDGVGGGPGDVDRVGGLVVGEHVAHDIVEEVALAATKAARAREAVGAVVVGGAVFEDAGGEIAWPMRPSLAMGGWPMGGRRGASRAGL